KKFPGIGDPGADRLLLAGGSARTLAAESNGLRVLLRLGFGDESADYARSYRSVSKAVTGELPDDREWLLQAHQLLRRHGQATCRRTTPRCEECPLTGQCAFYLANVS